MMMMQCLPFLLLASTALAGRLQQFEHHLAGHPVYAFPPNLSVQKYSAVAVLKGEEGISGTIFFDQEFFEGAPVHVYGTVNGLPYSPNQDAGKDIPLPKAPPLRIFDYLVNNPNKPITLRVLEQSETADVGVDRATVLASLKEWKPAWGISCFDAAQNYANHLSRRYAVYSRRKREALDVAHSRNSFSFFGQTGPLPWSPRHFPPPEPNGVPYVVAAIFRSPDVHRDIAQESLEARETSFSNDSQPQWSPTWAVEHKPVERTEITAPPPPTPKVADYIPLRQRLYTPVPFSRGRRDDEERKQRAMIQEAVRSEVQKLIQESRGPCNDALFHISNESPARNVHRDFSDGERPGPPPPPLHGIHIHQFGNISGPGCLATGPHFNPDFVQHGGPASIRRHVGDLGNIIADQPFYIVDNRISLFGRNNILGRSVVIHAQPDDWGREKNARSRSSGNAGKRVACGVIGRRDITFFHN